VNLDELKKTKYEWLADYKAERLHFFAEFSSTESWDTLVDAGSLELTPACGVTARYHAPGVFSRIGMPRCGPCCDVIGLPAGDGCPINDKELNGGS
jgi:hypothetical protein